MPPIEPALVMMTCFMIAFWISIYIVFFKEKVAAILKTAAVLAISFTIPYLLIMISVCFVMADWVSFNPLNWGQGVAIGAARVLFFVLVLFGGALTVQFIADTGSATAKKIMKWGSKNK